MKLYDAAWAPSPRRVRIFLAEKGIEIEREMIDLRKNEQFEPAFLAINPRGTVPVLQLDDGTPIDDSVAICRYLEAIRPDPPLFGRSPIEIARIEAWSRRTEADGYQAAVLTFRNSLPAFDQRGLPGKWPPVPQIPALVERAAIMWEGFLDALEERLAEGEWIAGADYSFADISALVAVDFGRSARLADACARPAIARWHAAATARPSASV